MKIIGAIITLPLLFYLPGLAIYRSRFFRRGDLSWIESVLIVVTLSVSLASLTALFLVEAGYLRIWLLDLILGAFALAMHVAFSTSRPVILRGPSKRELAAVALLIVLACALFFRPAEYVVGERDPGYYFSNGFHMAQTGSATIHEEDVPNMPAGEFAMTYDNKITQFIPFQALSKASGDLQPLLTHLLPTWMALFMMMSGPFGGFFVAPLFALLAMLALYALARRLGGIAAAITAALLASLCFIEIWFARIPSTEVMAQFFMIATLLFVLAYIRTRTALPAVCAALALTCAATLRQEAVLLFVPMFAVLILEIASNGYRKADRAFANTLLVGLAVVWVNTRFFVRLYIAEAFKSLLFGNFYVFMNVLAVVIALLFVAFNIRPLIELIHRAWGWIAGRVEPRLASVKLILKVAFALVVLEAFASWYLLGRVSAAVPIRLFSMFGVFLAGALVLVFVVGLCLLIYKSEFMVSTVVTMATLTGIAACVGAAKSDIGVVPFDMRRFLVLVAPLLFVGFGFLFAWLWKTRVVAVRVVAALGAGFFVFISAANSAAILNHVEYKGIDAQIAMLSDDVRGDTVLFTSAIWSEMIALPMRYQHEVDARRVYTLADVKALTDFASRSEQRGTRLLLEASEADRVGMDARAFDLLTFREVLRQKIVAPRLAQTYGTRPGRKTAFESDLILYEVSAKKPEAPPAAGAAHIESVQPTRARWGDLMVVEGSGFLRAQNRYLTESAYERKELTVPSAVQDLQGHIFVGGVDVPESRFIYESDTCIAFPVPARGQGEVPVLFTDALGSSNTASVDLVPDADARREEDRELIFGSGWYEPESGGGMDFRFSKKAGRVLVYNDPSKDTLSIKMLATLGPMTGKVFVNGVESSAYTLDSFENAIKVKKPASRVEPYFLTIDIVNDKLVIPDELLHNTDKRQLGAALVGITQE